jgi:hexosaminidase
LDFLQSIHQLVDVLGRRMMFWGDIIVKHPDAIPQIPRDAIALCWGYEATSDLDAQAARFAESGIPFYVCPGTSSWNSISGRTANMLANQRAAAAAGLKHGAVGYLNTDWGDNGHLQYLPISFAGLAAGAAVSWCLQSNPLGLEFSTALDLHAFADDAGVMGKLARQFGNVQQAVGIEISNRSALFSILVPSSAHADPMQRITLESLAAAEAAIDAAIAPVNDARMRRRDAGLIREELANAAEMLRYACRRGRAALDPDARQSPKMEEQLHAILASHRRCWLARNRPGGLDDSVNRLI